MGRVVANPDPAKENAKEEKVRVTRAPGPQRYNERQRTRTHRPNSQQHARHTRALTIITHMRADLSSCLAGQRLEGVAELLDEYKLPLLMNFDQNVSE